MINSTFGGFMTARLGMSASQQALNITGQNVSNINTPGYTRQYIDQVSLNVGGGSNRYASGMANIGNGVWVTGTGQVRDPFLDRRFRNEISFVGQYDIKTSGLQNVQDILDETGKTDGGGGIHNQLADFRKQLNELSKNPNAVEHDSMVRGSADSLVKLLNSYSQQLEKVRKDAETDLKDVDIPAINNILKNIAELNKSIKSAEVCGDSALELKDQRNMLIDELASYMPIEVKYKPITVTDGRKVDELTINFVSGDGKELPLLIDEYPGSLEVEKDQATGNWSLKYTGPDGLGGMKPFPIDITNSLSTGSLKSSLEHLNAKGEFDNPPTTTKGIGYYENMLDVLARDLATTMNDMNKVPVVDADGNAVMDPNNPKEPLMKEFPLFTKKDPNADWSADNIQIAEGWTKKEYGVIKNNDAKWQLEKGAQNPPTQADMNKGSLINNDKGSSNILDMIAEMDKSRPFTTQGAGQGEGLFTGTFEEFYSNMVMTLGQDIKSTTEILNNHVTMAGQINGSRDNLSAVSMDEEGINMMRFSKSYAASARMMTTLDEILDTLINRMGV